MSIHIPIFYILSTMKKEAKENDYRGLSRFTKEELLKLIAEAKSILQKLHHVPEHELVPKEEGIPVEVFATELSPSEAAVKWLKEQGLGYHDIGVKLSRDERGIWGSYRRASAKMPAAFAISHPEVLIPFSVLANRTTSMLESIVFYLKESKGSKLIQIARMLNKHSSTIWTVYNRAKKKQRGKDET